jgi:hypothetical protein
MNSIFGAREIVSFQQQIYGTWGCFKTPSGMVHFLETKARIGAASKDLEKRLTNFLRPVREILPTLDMDFNQLLQRDLDDHRVATSLVPYILDMHCSGPAFFPPIVAAVLPFEGKYPKSHFPSVEEVSRTKDSRAPWKGYRFGSAFQFERMQDPNTDDDYDIKLGRLSWNPEEARFVVIDGQHRAMALLAIDRTINNSWSESGEQYRYFYEREIEKILSTKSDEERKNLFENLEFPVTILWFPDCNKLGADHHQAARRLFVDVNKNARTPSESRLVLLSDTELLSIFTRRILNELRSTQDTAPIYCVEYDHPGRDQTAYSKWSVISNVITIRDCINRSIFGPEKYIKSVNINFWGRESEFDRAHFMRETLSIGEGIGETEDDIKREEITNDNFPPTKLDFLSNQVMRGWGEFIVKMLSDLLPFKIHAEVLEDMRKDWATADSTDRLAKNAIFEGVGMFWTIRDSFQHWERQNNIRKELKKNILDKTEIVKTWDVIEIKKKDFEERRAKKYLGKSDVNTIKEANSAFDSFSTNACQVGLVLAARTIVWRMDISINKLMYFNRAFIAAVNRGLEGGPKSHNGRRTIFWTGHTDPLNRIPKLDSPFAVYFRYFWLELMCSNEAIGLLNDWISQDDLQKLRDEARAHYFEFLVKDFAKSIKRTNPMLSKKEVEKRADNSASDALRKSLLKWFDINKAAFEVWKNQLDIANREPLSIRNNSREETDESLNEAESLIDSNHVSLDALLKDSSEEGPKI